MKKILLISSLILLSLPNFVFAALFSSEGKGKTTNQTSAFYKEVASVETAASTPEIYARVFSLFLGFLGLIFLVLVISSGYNWMTAQGDEEKITKAKDTLKTAIIGLLIIVSAYAITYFVFNNLPGSGGGSSGGGGGVNIGGSSS